MNKAVLSVMATMVLASGVFGWERYGSPYNNGTASSLRDIWQIIKCQNGEHKTVAKIEGQNRWRDTANISMSFNTIDEAARYVCNEN